MKQSISTCMSQGVLTPFDGCIHKCIWQHNFQTTVVLFTNLESVIMEGFVGAMRCVLNGFVLLLSLLKLRKRNGEVGQICWTVDEQISWM